jgi:hypothetical protein
VLKKRLWESRSTPTLEKGLAESGTCVVMKTGFKVS